jgi:hypothetical protein
MRRSFHWHVEVRALSDGGVLGGDMTVVTGSIRCTGNLPYRADVVARGGAEATCGQNGNNLEPRMEERGGSDKAMLNGSRLFWPGSVDWHDY